MRIATVGSGYLQTAKGYIMSRRPSVTPPFQYLPRTIMSEFVWRKQEYAKELRRRPEDTRRVMVIYSGGTLGMKYIENQGYVPVPSFMETKMKTYPMFYDGEYHIGEEQVTAFAPFQPIPLPITYHKDRILYCIKEYNPLLDSCNMNMDDWAKLARDVEQYYDQFDGFVILHGTDTVCYTASALSFMLENLGKPVVITGAQVPLLELRSDARDNLLGALLMAGSGHYVIPEVTLYFSNKLLRGNRSTKMNSASFDAFESPNMPPLATVGVDVLVQRNYVLSRGPEMTLKVYSTMCPDVGILKVFPGITPAALGAFLQAPMKGIVLQTFGAGNVPAQPPLLQRLKEACDRGVVIVNCTQCSSGNVTTNYPAARDLCELGVVSGADLTVEAALTKLSYLLGRPDLDTDAVREYMARNMCGELTCTDAEDGLCEPENELDLLLAEAMPSLVCTAAAQGDNVRLALLLQKGGRVDQADYDGRTALHLACSKGQLDTVRLLVDRGASVNAPDRFHNTPLHNAIHFKRGGVVKALVEIGASITSDEFKSENASKIFQLAATDDVEGLSTWQDAGIDLAHINYLRLSPLEVAQRSGATNAESFLKGKN